MYIAYNNSDKKIIAIRETEWQCRMNAKDIDLFALVWLDSKLIAWLPYEECKGWKKSIKKKEFDKYSLERALSILKSND